MTLVTMTTDLIEHAHGDPVASADAAAIAVFVHQSPAGSFVIDIYTRDDTERRVRLLLDGELRCAAPPGKVPSTQLCLSLHRCCRPSAIKAAETMPVGSPRH